jgi:hypothetical protein
LNCSCTYRCTGAHRSAPIPIPRAHSPNRATLCAHARPSNQGTLEYLALQSFSDDADAKASAKFENAKMLDHPNVAKVTHKPSRKPITNWIAANAWIALWCHILHSGDMDCTLVQRCLYSSAVAVDVAVAMAMAGAVHHSGIGSCSNSCKLHSGSGRDNVDDGVVVTVTLSCL